MECYNCGSVIKKSDRCPVCGTDLREYSRFLSISDHLYNKALSQARERNLYGAVQNLRLSLAYNKVNIDARNLLGLVLYERGEATLAIGQWLISKSIKPEDNIANSFLEDTERNTIERERINQTCKKYNITLGHMRNQAYDLASMQLKKVLELSPNFVRARQLQALCFMHEDRPEGAIATLKESMRTDSGDPLTLLYMKNAKEQKKGIYRPKQQATRTNSGNDVIITPKHSKVNGVLNVILNFVIGVAIGAAIIWYLAVPTIKRDAASEANNISLQSSETLSTKNQQISVLEEQLSEANDTIKDAEKRDAAHAKETAAFEKLLEAYQAYAGEDPDTAGDYLDETDEALLSDKGLASYQYLSDKILSDYLTQTYEAANHAYNGSNITDAKEYYSRIVALDENYDEGNAIYNLAQCCRKLREYDEALKYYKRAVELFPEADFAGNAGVYINQLSED